MKFQQREVGKCSIAIIDGNDWEHIKANRFFTTYTYDKKFEVFLGDNVDSRGKRAVFIRLIEQSTDMRMCIGWVYEEQENGKATNENGLP